MFTAPSHGQSLQLAGDTFNETLRDSAEISGALVAGLHIQNKTNSSIGVDPKLPPGLVDNTTVCVRILSANGLYDSENEYVFSATAQPPDGPMVDLSASAHIGFLKDLVDHEIAASVSTGTCEDRAQQFIASSWAQSDTKTLTLFLNSFQADAAFIRLDDGSQNVRCEPVDVAIATAYDMVCTFDLPGISSKELELSIVRFVNRQPAPATSFSILLPE